MHFVYITLLLLFVYLVPFFCLAQEQSLPLGDGKISANPKSGYTFSCRVSQAGGGAAVQGPWIHGNQWSPQEKLSVNGNMIWPGVKFDIKEQGKLRIITGNGLPMHPTGNFPMQPSDTAYAYDPNPNAIAEVPFAVALPADPQLANSASCLPMGMVGIMLTGAPLFSALDASGRDAPAHEVQDQCAAHPSPQGQYHYHGWSDCMKDSAGGHGMHSDLAGYALDGFGIYGPIGENGKLLTNADLDACHGHTHTIPWNGRMVKMYHYHFTAEYPYSLGCFAGTPTMARHEVPAHAAKQKRAWRVVPYGPRGVAPRPIVVH